MVINLEETSLPEVKILRFSRFPDNRGFFSETYKLNDYLDLGIPSFVQDNLSESNKGVVRGLHWQETPFGQGKLVTCIKGRIYDVAVDVRIGSPSFGEHFSVELNAAEPKSLWIPEGFAHGFQSLEDNSYVMYKVTNYWNKDYEKSLNPLTAKIDWPISDYCLSEKDSSAPDLSSLFNL